MSTLKVDNIRHNNATSDAITMAADGTCTANITGMIGGGVLSHKNIAINGAMQVAQRGSSTTISTGNNTNASGVYTVDRMKLGCYVGSERYTLSQETDAPTGSGFTKSFKIKTSTADTSANAGTYAQFVYQIEGQDLQHLLKGTSSAKPLTISFWCKGNTNYTPVAELKDNTNTRINVQTFNVTSSWTKVVLTYVGDTTGGTIDNDNTAGLSFNVWLKAAAAYSGGTSPAQNTWVAQSSQNIRAALLTFDIGASTDNYFQITGLQIEVGDVATPFEFRSFGDELKRCLRYYEQSYRYGEVAGSTNNNNGNIDQCISSNSTGTAVYHLRFFEEKRANPTVTFYRADTGTSGQWMAGRSGANSFNVVVTVDSFSTKSCRTYVSVSVNYAACFIQGHYTAEAEL